MRSVFVQWSLLERERDRPLRDLAESTALDSIELSHVYLLWGPGDPRTDPAPLVLPTAHGFDDLPVPVLGPADFEQVHALSERVRNHGFDVVCNLSPLFIAAAELRHLACVDVTGAFVPGIHPRLPVYGCPANPEVVAYGEAMASAVAGTWESLTAVGLNHIEYPVWPQKAVRELFTCFCEACCRLAAADGIDVERVRREVLRFYESLPQPCPPITPASVLAFVVERPELARWLRLRRDAVSAYAARVVAALRRGSADRGAPLRLGLEFQLPALAALVGTDFPALAPFFDWMTPKFPDYLGGSVLPVVAEELATRNGGSAAELRQRLRELVELGVEPDSFAPVADPSEGLLYDGAFRPDVIALQREHVDGRVAGRPVYPYLWLYGGDLELLRAKLAAVQAAGWDGFFLWCWDSDLTTEAIRAARGIL